MNCQTLFQVKTGCQLIVEVIICHVIMNSHSFDKCVHMKCPNVYTLGALLVAKEGLAGFLQGTNCSGLDFYRFWSQHLQTTVRVEILDLRGALCSP